MNFPLDPEMHLRCHRWEQQQRETQIHRRRQALLADPRSTASRGRSRWRRS
ncbi:hypothetical protein [Nakamurella deserti]|uniref:hypothetical protein n=1 Tax=Nakamurella deserti TaxID=2164074 RepID=UPI001300A45D|nr:hypothetical protein [Nakamurella deserti]